MSKTDMTVEEFRDLANDVMKLSPPMTTEEAASIKKVLDVAIENALKLPEVYLPKPAGLQPN
jgi:hypothetical protein